MKKIISITLLICSLFSFTSCKKNAYFVPLGNFSSSLVDLISSNISMKAKNYFTSATLTSGELFKIVDSNASYVEDNRTYSFYGVIEKTDLVILSIGLMDILPSLHINQKEKTLDYDEDFISRQLEILDYHLMHIIEGIRLINHKCDVLVLGNYVSLTFEEPESILYESIITRINRILLTSASTMHVEYISLLEAKDQDDKDSFIGQVISSHYER